MIDNIRDIFGNCIGSPVIQCACGRYNYCNSDFMDEGEFERLEVEDKKCPNNYCYHSDGSDSVTATRFNGGEYVFGCNCKWEERLENFLDNHQKEFVTYYKNKIARDLKKTQESVELLKSL
jgi:hypothetical protein